MDTTKRWRRVLAIWLGMYPVNVATSWAITLLPWWGDLVIPARSALLVTVIAPLMTFVMMPTITRLLAGWLSHCPEHVRCERALNEALDELPATPRWDAHWDAHWDTADSRRMTTA